MSLSVLERYEGSQGSGHSPPRRRCRERTPEAAPKMSRAEWLTACRWTGAGRNVRLRLERTENARQVKACWH